MILRKTTAVLTLLIIVSATFFPLKVALAADPVVIKGGVGPAGNCTPGKKGCDYIALTTIPGATVGCKTTTGDTKGCIPVDPVKVIKNFYGVAIGIAAVLAVIMIIYAGIEYATIESITGKSDAKDRWQGALIGLGLLLASYLILRTINIDLVNVNLDLGQPLISPKKADQNSLENFLTTIQSESNRLIEVDRQANQNVDKEVARLAAIDKSKQDRENKLQKIDELQTKIRELQSQGPIADPQIKLLREQITILEEETNEIQSSIDLKVIAGFDTSKENPIFTLRDKIYTQELKNLNDLVVAGKLQEAQLDSRVSLQRISDDTTEKINSVSRTIAQANAQTLTGEAAKQRDAFVLKLQQDIAYLVVSKNGADAMRNSLVTIADASGVRGTSARFDAIASSYIQKKIEFGKINRNDLGDRILTDLNQMTNIMKIRNLINCRSYTSAEKIGITLCTS